MEEDIKRHARAFADWYAEAEKEARASAGQGGGDDVERERRQQRRQRGSSTATGDAGPVGSARLPPLRLHQACSMSCRCALVMSCSS